MLYINCIICIFYSIFIYFIRTADWYNSQCISQVARTLSHGQAQGSVLTNMKMRPELTRAHTVPLDGRCYLFTFSELLPIGSTHHTIISFMLTKNLFQSVCDFSNCTSTVLKRGARESIN